MPPVPSKGKPNGIERSTMEASHNATTEVKEIHAFDHISGHRPGLFKGQKAAILDLLHKNRGQWIPAYSLSAVALQYNARVKELRDAGYVIENQTARHGRQVHGSFRLVACPGDEVQR
jgi:hypothetical protein